MSDQTAVLSASLRERLGSRYAKRARQQGRMPAVIYGHGEQPLSVELDAKDALNHINKGEKVFTVDLGSSQATVLLKDVQFDYLGTNIIHCDFARVDLNERVKTKVSLRFVGEAIGLKSVGTLLMHPTSELDIECRVADLPESIEVDVTNVDVGEQLVAHEVALPGSDMKLLTDPNAPVVQVVQSGKAKSAEAEEVEAEGEAQPEVIGEKKEDAE